MSPPFSDQLEKDQLIEVINSNWIAPVGPHIDVFERKLGNHLNGTRVLALQTGSASLQLALQLLGVGKGDEVLCNTFTFCATANAIIHNQATPVFIDADADDWTIDVDLLEAAIIDRMSKSAKPKAILCVHNYGMPCDMEAIGRIAKKYEIPIVEDAAESLGSKFKGEMTGTFGAYAALSFNGNKIITTGGGGALVLHGDDQYEAVKHLCCQARVPGPDYTHDEVGYNLRMSNVLAAIGIAQLSRLEEVVAKRRRVFSKYQHLLDISGYQREKEGRFSNRWLSAFLFHDQKKVGDLIKSFSAHGIEVRKLWTPLHLQKPYLQYPKYISGTSEALNKKGLCLPSGFSLTDADLDLIIKLAS